MSMLLKLNQYLLVPILIDWVSSEDILHLLSSISCRKTAIALRNLISKFRSLFESKLSSSFTVYPISSQSLKWWERWDINATESLFVFDSLSRGASLSSCRRAFSRNSDFIESLSHIVDFRLTGALSHLDPLQFGKHLSTLHLESCFCEDIAREICRRCPNLLDLKISPTMQRSTVFCILINCRRLKHIMLLTSGWADKKRAQYVFVLHYKCNLETLGLAGLPYKSAMSYFGSMLKEVHLGALNGASMTMGSVFPLMHVLRYAHFQRTTACVDFSTLPNLTDLEYSATDGSLLQVTHACPLLRMLRFELVDAGETLSHDTLCSISKLVYLESLRTDYSKLTDDVMLSIVEGCKSLTKLLIPYSGLTDSFWVVFSGKFPNIMELYFSTVKATTAGVRTVISNCSSLKALKLSLYHHIAQSIIDYILVNSPSLLYLRIENQSKLNVNQFNTKNKAKFERYLVSQSLKHGSLYDSLNY